MTSLRSAHDGPVLTVTLDRPDRLNALSDQLADALADELERASSYDDVRVVVLRGAGRAFCAGADISLPADRGTGAMQLDVHALDRANRIIRAVTRLDKPVVAAVQGAAAGVGCSIALAADLCIAAESASFLLAFARVGLMPDGGSTASVAASVGRARAMRMALLGEPLTGREAHRAGLVSHLADDDAFETVVAGVTHRLAAGAPLAQAATKRAVNAATFGGLDDALERERTGQTILLRTHDAGEGMAAFAERRTPAFEGE
jgi:enoyl-CoA hydratase